jgi:ribosomal protein S18 acetylase RimI-like enzyme
MIRDSALIKVRIAKASDGDALNRVFREAWRQAYTGIIPPMHLERMIRRRDARWWRNAIKTESNLLVLEVAGVVAGYASCGAARCGKAGYGEIYEIYVAPVYQGVGLGEHLFEACRHQLDLSHFAGLLVWALADNVEAGDFYWRRGGRPIAQAKERFGTTQLAKIAYSFG